MISGCHNTYHLKILGKIQRRAIIWILWAFKTSISYGIETLAGLIPINLHLQKLGGYSQLRAYKLLSSHLIHSLIDSQLNPQSNLNAVALNSLSNWQCSLVKDHLVDMTNWFNKCFPSFTPLDSEFSPGYRVIDNFSERISFNICRKGNNDKLCEQELNEMPSLSLMWASRIMSLHLSSIYIRLINY